ncbi:MAG: biotin transporter BioY [Acidimicrobiales bacterium]|jgi:biotin transport system substrate-specific component
MSTVAVQTAPRRVLADLLPRTVVADILLVVGAAGLVGLLAQISIHLSFTPVPITGQTLGVLLAGSALGWRRAGLSMSLYLLAGLAGVPWFADHSSGYAGATFGYLVGFVAAGMLLGWLAARGSDRNIVRAALSMVLAEVLLYAIALPWLAVDLHVSLAKAFSLGMWPFVAGDVIKAALAGVALPSAWRLVRRSTKD